MKDKEIINITLSSIQKRISLPLEDRFYSIDEVKDLLKITVGVIDDTIYEYLEKESEE